MLVCRLSVKERVIMVRDVCRSMSIVHGMCWSLYVCDVRQWRFVMLDIRCPYCLLVVVNVVCQCKSVSLVSEGPCRLSVEVRVFLL